jgi:hypothetical protein
MRKSKKYFGHEMYIGVYFLNIWLDLMGETDIQAAFNGIQKQPFKALPKLIQAGVNSYNEIEGKDERISFIDACGIFEEYGVNSPDFQNIVKDLTDSLKIDNPEKKNKPKAVRPKK